MPAPTGVLWDRDPHTEAKHQLLEWYLEAWFPIIAARFGVKGLTYVDAFAGPGEYKDGALGSPMITLRQGSRGDVRRYGIEQRFLFIEKQKNRFEHLRDLVVAAYPLDRRPATLRVFLEHGDCQKILIPALAQHRIKDGPIFVNFDGWGVDTPMGLVRHIGRMEVAEALITFKPGWFGRFVNAPDPAAGDRVFGDSSWREIAREDVGGEDKKRNLVDHYRGQLRAAGFEYQLPFELLDEGGRELFLVYGTSNIVGVEKMKEAMWKVDGAKGQSFRDPRDVKQLSLELVTGPNLVLLRRQILEVLRAGPRSLAELKRYALVETIFKPTHATEAVKELEEQGLISRSKAAKHEDQIVELSLLGHMAPI